MTLEDLVARAAAVDEVAPFNEASMLSLGNGSVSRVHLLRTDTAGNIVAAAHAHGGAPVELVVDPEHRCAGIGRSLLNELLTGGEREFWAHGDLPAAQTLAAGAGLRATRALLVLRLTVEAPPLVERVPAGVTLRPYAPADVDDIIRVNARAFAGHPEQGAMDRADFERRTSTPWFDPAGLFIAEHEGRVVGFHWTKANGGLGEVYVIAIDPDAQGGGLGKALTAHGLEHLYEKGARTVDLYVEGDNTAALAVYHRLGFAEHAKDVLYTL